MNSFSSKSAFTETNIKTFCWKRNLLPHTWSIILVFLLFSCWFLIRIDFDQTSFLELLTYFNTKNHGGSILRGTVSSGKHRGAINNGGKSIRFVILDWCHFCHQDWCNFAGNNSDFMSSETNRALRFHSVLGGCSLYFKL